MEQLISNLSNNLQFKVIYAFSGRTLYAAIKLRRADEAKHVLRQKMNYADKALNIPGMPFR